MIWNFEFRTNGTKYVVPTELKLFIQSVSYKYLAPTELKHKCQQSLIIFRQIEMKQEREMIRRFFGQRRFYNFAV